MSETTIKTTSECIGHERYVVVEICGGKIKTLQTDGGNLVKLVLSADFGSKIGVSFPGISELTEKARKYDEMMKLIKEGTK